MTKHREATNRGFLITLQHSVTGFAHRISRADHWLALSQGKGRTRENLAPCLPGGNNNRFHGQSSLSQGAGFKAFLGKYRKTAPNFHSTGASHCCQLTLFYLPSHSIYYFLPGQPGSCCVGDFHSGCASMETKEFSHSGIRKIFWLCCNLWLRKIKSLHAFWWILMCHILRTSKEVFWHLLMQASTLILSTYLPKFSNFLLNLKLIVRDI